jgi:hypothetical protein
MTLAANLASLQVPIQTSSLGAGVVNATTLDVGSANGTGALIVPSGTTAQRPGSTTAGYIRFNTTLNTLESANGTAWANVGSGSASSGSNAFADSNSVILINNTVITSNTTIGGGKGAMSVGPVTQANGVTLTLQANSRYIIL